MSERVNFTAGAMVNRDKDIVTQLGQPKSVRNGHAQLKSKAGAKRALAVIEATLAKRKAGNE